MTTQRSPLLLREHQVASPRASAQQKSFRVSTGVRMVLLPERATLSPSRGTKRNSGIATVGVPWFRRATTQKNAYRRHLPPQNAFTAPTSTAMAPEYSDLALTPRMIQRKGRATEMSAKTPVEPSVLPGPCVRRRQRHCLRTRVVREHRGPSRDRAATRAKEKGSPPHLSGSVRWCL